MLQIGNQLRFTSEEIKEARALGLDLAAVRTRDEYSKAVINLISTLEHERPDLLEKIAQALAAKTGAKLPAKLSVVRSTKTGR